MLHEDCTEGKRLLDSYLMALSIMDSMKRSAGNVTAPQEKDAQETLILARRMYWTHVDRHECRR